MALSKRKHYHVSKLDVSELGVMRFRSGVVQGGGADVSRMWIERSFEKNIV